MPVEVCELPGSPTFEYDDDRGTFSCTRMVRVSWGDIDAYCTQLLPTSDVVGGQIVQYLGEECPYLSGLFVKKFTFAPFFGEQDKISNTEVPVTYEYAKFVITYDAPNYYGSNDSLPVEPTDPVVFLEHVITSGGQLLDVSDRAGKWLWQAGLEVVGDEVPVPVMIGTSQHSVHWPRVPRPHWPNLNAFKGHVNASTFVLGGYPYPAESLLYLNFDRRDTVMSNRLPTHDLTLHFEGKLVKNNSERVDDGFDEYGGHNHFWKKEAGAWAKILESSDSSISPYPKADFNLLFAPRP